MNGTPHGPHSGLGPVRLSLAVENITIEGELDWTNIHVVCINFLTDYSAVVPSFSFF